MGHYQNVYVVAEGSAPGFAIHDFHPDTKYGKVLYMCESVETRFVALMWIDDDRAKGQVVASGVDGLETLRAAYDEAAQNLADCGGVVTLAEANGQEHSF